MTFDALRPFLDFGNLDGLPTYESVAAKLQIGQSAVKTLIHRLRKRHGQILREEVGRTVTDPGEIDDELRSLCDAFVAAEAILGSS